MNRQPQVIQEVLNETTFRYRQIDNQAYKFLAARPRLFSCDTGTADHMTGAGVPSDHLPTEITHTSMGSAPLN